MIKWRLFLTIWDNQISYKLHEQELHWTTFAIPSTFLSPWSVFSFLVKFFQNTCIRISRWSKNIPKTVKVFLIGLKSGWNWRKGWSSQEVPTTWRIKVKKGRSKKIIGDLDWIEYLPKSFRIIFHWSLRLAVSSKKIWEQAEKLKCVQQSTKTVQYQDGRRTGMWNCSIEWRWPKSKRLKKKAYQCSYCMQWIKGSPPIKYPSKIVRCEVIALFVEQR